MATPNSLFRRIVARLTPPLFGTITYIHTNEPAVALTFDDGPHPDFTPELLAILARYHARATFFMVGTNAKKYPEIVRLVAEHGHTIGNHSWDHPSFQLIPRKARKKQIRQCESVLPLGKDRLFRPPYGHQNLTIRISLLLRRYRVVTWNLAADDWLDHSSERILARLEQGLQPGSIILLHDALYTMGDLRYAQRNSTLEAVDGLLNKYSPHYHFVTVPELFRQGSLHREQWFTRPNIDWLNSRIKIDGNPRRYR